MSLQDSDVRSEPSASGSETDESDSEELGWKEGQTIRQLWDSWNRARGRLEKKMRNLLARFPRERYLAALKVTQQQAEAGQTQQQQQQPEAASATVRAEAGLPPEPAGAELSEDPVDTASSDLSQWNHPMAIMVMHAPHGKQSIFRSSHLAPDAAPVAHKAAMMMCSSIHIAAEQQRLVSSIDALDLPQPRIGHMSSDGNTEGGKKRQAPSKDLRDQARRVFATHAKPKLTASSKAFL